MWGSVTISHFPWSDLLVSTLSHHFSPGHCSGALQIPTKAKISYLYFFQGSETEYCCNTAVQHSTSFGQQNLVRDQLEQILIHHRVKVDSAFPILLLDLRCLWSWSLAPFKFEQKAAIWRQAVTQLWQRQISKNNLNSKPQKFFFRHHYIWIFDSPAFRDIFLSPNKVTPEWCSTWAKS